MELFPPEEFDRKDIEEGIDFIKTYHSNKSKKIIMPEEELNKNLYFKAKLVKLRLEVPQEHYSVDYQKHLEESSFYLPLPSRPSVDQLFSRYKSEYYPDVPYDQEMTESLIRDRKEIDKLVQRMIPDDPLAKFFEFIEKLKKKGEISTLTDESEGSEKSVRDVSVHHELGAAENIIKKQNMVIRKLRKKEKYLLRELNNEELNELIFNTKKKNGKPNFSEMSKILGYHRTTIKSELKRRGIIP